MNTILNEAVNILKYHPDGLSFDDLYSLVRKNRKLTEIQYQENKFDLFVDLNQSIEVTGLGDKWFYASFLRGRELDTYQHKQTHEISSVPAFVDTYVPALQKEFEYSYLNRKRYQLTDGLQIEKIGEVYSYAFDCTDQINIPSDSAIHIYLKENHYFGTMISCSDDVVIFESLIDFGEEIKFIEIATDTKYLIKALIDKLSVFSFRKGTIAERLVSDGVNQITNEYIEKGQENAIKHAKEKPITFIWGPPGTGKTHTLAKIALDFIERGKRVLMVSYSNVSVDGAIDRVDRLSNKKYHNGEIVRYGFPRDKKLIDDARLNSYSFVLSKNTELYKEYTDLHLRRKTVDKKSAERKSIDERLEFIRKHFKSEEHKLVSKSLFIATTVTKAVVDEAIYEQEYDLVLFDEASMAYVPHVIYTARLAKKSFVCLGDYQQLPPIAIMKDTPLTHDIFEYVGISQAVKYKKGHNWLVMLDEQRRMVPEIADFISRKMYYSELISAPEMKTAHQEVRMIAPFKNEPISCIDLSEMYSICTDTTDSSYVNVLSAFVTVCLVSRIVHDNPKIANKSIGIITPYNAQARLLRSMLNNINLQQVKCATVHQFQGSECDVILFDSVDCYLRRFPSNLLVSDRLVNVALSRAKGKFIFIGNIDYLDEKVTSSNHMIYGLLKKIKDDKLSYKDKRIYNAIQMNTGKLLCGSEEQYVEMYYDDLRNAKKEICIDLRGYFKDKETEIKLGEILTDLYRKGINVAVRFEAEKKIPEKYKRFSSNGYPTNTVTVIDGTIVWHGYPSYDAKFQSLKKLLDHSLNPVFRINDKKAASGIINSLSIKPAAKSEFSQVKEIIKRVCPLCNHKLQKIAVNEITCSSKSCDYSERVLAMDENKLAKDVKIYSIYAGDRFKTCTKDGIVHLETSLMIQTPEFVSIRNEKGKMKSVYKVVKLFEFAPKTFESMKKELNDKDTKKLDYYLAQIDSISKLKKYTFMFLEEVAKVSKNVIIKDKNVQLLEYKDLLD